MDLEYKPTTENLALTKELEEIVIASIKWILEKDLPALKQMTRLQFWFRKAYDLGKYDAIKTATPQELLQNEYVEALVGHAKASCQFPHKDHCDLEQAVKKFEVKSE